MGVGWRIVVALVVMAGASALAPPGGSSAGAVAGSDGATAVWDVDRDDLPTAGSTSFTALVSRLGCSHGVTGTVLDPSVSMEAERIVVTFEVEALPPGDYTCPGNDWVPYEVTLGEPIGERSLVDGACLSGEAATTGSCLDGPTRWSAVPAPTLPPSTETSVPAPPDPQCLPDGSIPPGADRCVQGDAPVVPGPAPEAGPARPIPTDADFTG